MIIKKLLSKNIVKYYYGDILFCKKDHSLIGRNWICSGIVKDALFKFQAWKERAVKCSPFIAGTALTFNRICLAILYLDNTLEKYIFFYFSGMLKQVKAGYLLHFKSKLEIKMLKSSFKDNVFIILSVAVHI